MDGLQIGASRETLQLFPQWDWRRGEVQWQVKALIQEKPLFDLQANTKLDQLDSHFMIEIASNNSLIPKGLKFSQLKLDVHLHPRDEKITSLLVARDLSVGGEHFGSVQINLNGVGHSSERGTGHLGQVVKIRGDFSASESRQCQFVFELGQEKGLL